MSRQPAKRDYSIGLMAGTSLDGVDAALVSWTPDAAIRLHAARTVDYPTWLVEAIRGLGPESSLREVSQMDAQLGEVFGEAARQLMDDAGIEPGDVDAIGSHGQTIWHAPEARYPTTVQIGDPNRIAEYCGVDTVADFRRRDIAAGGQGAPLAPLFHAALFGDAAEERAVLNLGGIANVTLFPPNGPITGFDTGPANTLLDAWHRRHHSQPFDRDGDWAGQGAVDTDLLEHLLTDPFFRQPPPRSTGPEHFNIRWLEARMGGRAIAPVDVQATLVELTARSAAEAITERLPGVERVLVCGGGAHNDTLMDRLAANLPQARVESTDAHGLHPDWVEAIGFAWLGRETLAGRTGNAPAVTGARHEAVLGGIYRGR